MPIFCRASDIVNDEVVLDISTAMDGAHNRWYLKLEALNPCGSIKLKTARYLVDAARRAQQGRIRKLIESSSGNLGIALASICAAEEIPFECVVDCNTLAEKIDCIRSLGAKVTIISEPDHNGGYLGSRIRYIKRRLEEDPELIWTNQYANTANAEAHFSTTAPALLRQLGHIDYLFIGAGTTGTLLGCARFFNEVAPKTKIVAVDAVGSVTFGAAPGKRHIPGIGTSQRPPLLDNARGLLFEVVYAEEVDTIRKCRQLSERTGLLIGGSTGSVLAAAEAYCREERLTGEVIAAISADLGQPYLSTIYSDSWVAEHYQDALAVPGFRQAPKCYALAQMVGGLGQGAE